MTSERKRAHNWTLKESLCLLDETFNCIAILKGHHKDMASAGKAKSDAWLQISNTVSSISDYQRSISECKTKYSNLLKEASKKISAHNKMARGTGNLVFLLSFCIFNRFLLQTLKGDLFQLAGRIFQKYLIKCWLDLPYNGHKIHLITLKTWG